MSNIQKVYDYADVPTVEKFSYSKAKIKGLKGPIGCLPAETEFLTPIGWKKISDYINGDIVAEFNLISRQIEFRQPLKYINLPCEEFNYFHNKGSLSMVLSDEHTVLYNTRFKPNEWRTISAKELYDKHNSLKDGWSGRIPTCWEGNNRNGLLFSDDELRLIVAFCADGYLAKSGRGTICVRRERKKIRLRELLIKCGIEWNERCYPYRPTEVSFDFIPPLKTKTLTSLWEANTHQLSIIVDEVPYWDGHRPEDSTELRFDSTKKEDVDFVQYAVSSLNKYAYIQEIEYPNNPTWKKGYSVHWGRSKEYPYTSMRQGNKAEKIPSTNGRKYCFTTTTGYFVVRHNGQIFITGNSGKSAGCVIELLRMAQEQQPSSDGIRRTKWGIVRNTYGDLVKTTMETFYDWAPPHMLTDYMKINKNDMRIVISDINEKTGRGTFHAEFLFLSADSASQIEGWRSLELTGAYCNELPLLSLDAFRMIHSRTGRFPKIERDTNGRITCQPTWSGTIFDANPPDIESWFYKFFEEIEYPEELPPLECNGCHVEYRAQDSNGICPECGTKYIELFHQPGGMEPDAENLRWLPGGRSYYAGLMIGNNPQWIKANVHGQYAAVPTGTPVYHNFQHSKHVYQGTEKLLPLRNIPVIVGIDLYGSCSGAIMQLSPSGRLTIFKELITNSYTTDFIEQFLTPALQLDYRGYEIILVIDPTGKDKGNVGISSKSLFEKAGYRTELAPTNDIKMRTEAVDYYMTHDAGKTPALCIDKGCRQIIGGMAGKYTKDAQGKPKKDDFSHPQDSVQYGALWLRHFQLRPKNDDIYIPDNWNGGGVRVF